MMPLMYAIINNSRDIEEASRRIDEGRQEDKDYRVHNEDKVLRHNHNHYQNLMLDEHYKRNGGMILNMSNKEYEEEWKKFNKRIKFDLAKTYEVKTSLRNEIDENENEEEIEITERSIEYRVNRDRDDSRDRDRNTEQSNEALNLQSFSGILRPYPCVPRPGLVEPVNQTAQVFHNISNYPPYDPIYQHSLFSLFGPGHLLHIPNKLGKMTT